MDEHLDRYAPLSLEERASGGATPAPADDADLVCPVPQAWANGVAKGDAPVVFLPRDLNCPGLADQFWPYRDAAGRVLGVALRWNAPGGCKEFRFATLRREPDGRTRWRLKHLPAPRPLYGLDRLAAAPGAPVVVVEGEKAADAAARIFPDAVATTSPGGANAAAKSDWSPLTGRRVLIWPDADEAGARYARDVTAALAGLGCDMELVDAAALVARLGVTGAAAQGFDAADAAALGRDLAELRALALECASPVRAQARATASRDAGPEHASWPAPTSTEAPRPLRREPLPGDPFPLDALGDVLGAAARAIVDKVQCPDAIAASSVLAAASLAVQAHADVVLPATGHARPLSLFFATVGESGERKSACDHEALWPIRRREALLREIYKAEIRDYRSAKRAFDAAISKVEKAKGGKIEIEAAIRDAGEEPKRPLEPTLTFDEVTVEGLSKALLDGHSAIGIFSDEAGAFINGHAMADEARLRTAAGLSKLWDGAPVKARRVIDGARVLPGRRVALHLMAQPDAMARMLADPTLADQGLLSRMLAAWPGSTIGTRFQRPQAPQTDAALRRYGARLLDILEEPPRFVADGELDPRRLEFAPDAAARWLGICDTIEAALAPGRPFEAIKGFGNKLAEQIARIAGVLTLVDDAQAGPPRRHGTRRSRRARLLLIPLAEGAPCRRAPPRSPFLATSRPSSRRRSIRPCSISSATLAAGPWRPIPRRTGICSAGTVGRAWADPTAPSMRRSPMSGLSHALPPSRTPWTCDPERPARGRTAKPSASPAISSSARPMIRRAADEPRALPDQPHEAGRPA